jgi:hypothetical protein
MARLTVSIKADQLSWLKQHREVNASGLMQKAIEQLIVGDLDYERKFVEELEQRLRSVEWKWRPRFVIDDVRFPITSSYPIEEANYIVAKAGEFAGSLKGLKKRPGAVTYPHPEFRGRQYFEIELYEASDTYTEPVVELKSKLMS